MASAANADNYEDLKVQQQIRHAFSDLGLCGCGSDDKHAILLAMLERAEAKGSFYEPLGDLLNARAVEFIADVMSSSRWDLLEHGTGIGCAWLTEKGELLLRFMRKFGTDSDAWPEWWCSVTVGEEW